MKAGIKNGLAFAGIWRSDVLPTLKLGMPLAGAQLAQISINATDVLMIGRLGTDELAASLLAFNLYILLWFFGMGLIQAVLPLASQARGRRAARELRRSVRMGFWVAILFSLPALLVMSFTEEIFLLLGQMPTVSKLAGDYMIWLQWTILPSLLVFAVRVFMTVMERSQIVLFATIAGALINGLVDYALIFGNFGLPRLELAGAGIASVASTCVTLAFLIVYALVQKNLRRYRIFGRFWRVDWPVLFKIVKLGLPIGVTIVAEAGLFSAASVLIGWLGSLPLAAHAVAMQLASVTFMVPLGISQAALTRVGLAAGRNDHAGVGRAGWTALCIALLFMALCALFFWIIPQPLVMLYLDFSNPQAMEVMKLATSLLAVAAFFQIVDGAQVVGTSILRALGDTTIPLIYALLGYWLVGIGLSLGLGFGLEWGAVGVWWGLAGGLASVAVLTTVRFYNRDKLGLMKRI